MINEIKTSNPLLNDFKLIALIFLRLIQIELQKYMFESCLYVQFNSIEKVDVLTNFDNMGLQVGLVLDKFIQV